MHWRARCSGTGLNFQDESQQETGSKTFADEARSIGGYTVRITQGWAEAQRAGGRRKTGSAAHWTRWAAGEAVRRLGGSCLEGRNDGS